MQKATTNLSLNSRSFLADLGNLFIQFEIELMKKTGQSDDPAPLINPSEPQRRGVSIDEQ